MGKVTSFWNDRCKWCNDIRNNYSLRAEILKKMNIDVPIDFINRTSNGRCPFHRLITVPPSLHKYKTEAVIKPSEKIAVLHWWSNRHGYTFTFHLNIRDATLYKDGEYIKFDNYDFEKMFSEFLMFLNQEQLKELLIIVNEITKEKLPKEFIEIIKTREENAELVEFEEKPAYYFTLKCEDKPITKEIQGYFEIDGIKYYKEAQSVWKFSP